jgi:ring-1,2-phenylacetyl-CoA epoxidase subunit PaaA
VPDDKLAYDEARGEWDWTEPDWDAFRKVVTGHGPMTETRLAWRRWMHDAHGWVREVMDQPRRSAA